MISARRARPWALLIALLGALALLGPTPAAADSRAPRDVVIVGAPGLSWSDVSARRTPAIHDFARDAAVANLNVRSTYYTSCPADGWLGLSAGHRAAAPRDHSRADLRADPRALPTCAALPDPGVGASSDAEVDVGAWEDLSAGVAEQGFGARIGALGSAVADAGGCLSGSGPGALLALSDEEGEIPTGEPGVHERCAIALVGAPPVTVPEEGGARTRQVRAADEVLAGVVGRVHPETLVLLAGISDDGGRPGLRVLALGGDRTPAGWLHSDSTTRDDMGQVADVTWTALSAAGVEPPGDGAGRDLVAVPDDAPFEERRDHLVDDDAQLRTAETIIPPFFRGYGFGLAALLGLLALGRRFGPARARPLAERALAVIALVALAMPASTYLVTLTPWFDAGSPLLAFVLALLLLDLALLVLALLAVRVLARFAPARWRPQGTRGCLATVGIVCGLTFVLLAGDLLLGGGRMTLLSVLGLLPLDGGRFHGFGNVPSAIFTASAFLLMIALASPLLAGGRRRAAVAVVGVLGLATFLVGAWLGADGGGALAILPAVGYLVLAIAGVRLTWVRVVGIAAGTVLGFLAMAGVDWLRPDGDRTHLGRFFQQLLDGRAWGVIVRKLETNVDLLLGPERTALLVPVLLVAVIWVLARPTRRMGRWLSPLFDAYRGLRIGLIALVVALTVGFLLNDSGAAIPAVAALILAPSLILLALGARRPRAPEGL